MTFLQNKFLWFSLLVIYPWFFIWQGFDMTDSGFSLSLYSNAFITAVPHDYPRWLTTMIGGLWNQYFGWLGYIGFKIAYILNIYVILFLSYKLLESLRIKREYSLFGLFLSLVFITKTGGNWINYNSLSSLFYIFVIYFLFFGYKKNNIYFIIFAGVFAGINIFVRFPNLLDFFLIFALVVIYILENKKLILKSFFGYSIGYLIGIILIIGLLYFLDEYNNYINSIQLLLFSPTKNYTTDSLLSLLIKDHLFILFFTIVFIVFIKFLPLKLFDTNTKRWILILSLTIVSLYALQFFRSWQYLYPGIFYLFGFLVFFDKEIGNSFKFLFLLSIEMFILISLGSDNGVYNDIYGMWLVFPLFISYLFQKDMLVVRNYVLLDNRRFIFFRNLFVVITLFFSLYQKNIYTYRDSSNRLDMRYSIDFDKLKGTYTTEKRASLSAELLNELQKRVKNRKLFVTDKMSTVYYLLNQIPPLSHPWAVDHMVSKKFKKEFLEYAQKTLPVITMAKYSVSTFRWPYHKAPLNNQVNTKENREVLKKFMLENDYSKVWENEYFEIWDRFIDAK